MIDKSNENIQETESGADKPMPFTSHLEELRQAVIISLISIIITTGFCFYFNKQFISFLTQPLIDSGKNIQLVFVSPGEAFLATIRMALIFGIIIAIPIILNRIYWFVAPGLTREEKKLSAPIIILAYFLFLSGSAFSYYALLPFGVKFLIDFAPENVAPMISIGNYMSFSSSLIIGTGLIFELPLILLLLAFLRIINTDFLKKNRRYAFLLSFIVGAIVTPSVDIMSQSILAGALYLLYEFSIVLIKMLEIRRKNNC